MPKRKDIPRKYLPHKVTTSKRRVVTGGGGQMVSTGDPIPCLFSAKRRLVRNSEGEQVVAEATLVTRLEYEGRFDTGYEVTLPSGRTTTVISANPHDDGGIAGAWCHLEVVCE